MQTSKDAMYLPRHVGLRLGIPQNVPAVMVNRLCGSGFQAAVNAAHVSIHVFTPLSSRAVYLIMFFKRYFWSRYCFFGNYLYVRLKIFSICLKENFTRKFFLANSLRRLKCSVGWRIGSYEVWMVLIPSYRL